MFSSFFMFERIFLHVLCQILTDYGHERVKVANVETLLSHVDEKLDDPRSVLLLCRLM